MKEKVISIFIFSLIGFLMLSFNPRSEVKQNEWIIPGKQAGTLVLGYTTIEEAKDSLRSPAKIVDDSGIESAWISIKPKRCEERYTYKFHLIDSSKGISIMAQCKDLHVIDQVRLTAPCKWKTTEGIGIGSSFEDIKAKMGPPKKELDTLAKPSSEYSAWHEISYENIEFYSFHKMGEPGGCCVDLMIVTCQSITRPDVGVRSTFIKRVKCKKLKSCTKC